MIKWSNFIRAGNDAKTACDNQGYAVAELFTDIGKKSSGGRPSQDYQLTRFACYMIALSADGTKPEVAAAKTYIAIKTHEREQEEIGLLADPEMAFPRSHVMLMMARQSPGISGWTSNA